MSIRHYSGMKLCVAVDHEKLSIEFDLTDIYLNYKGNRLMIADHELFDLLKNFMEKNE